MLSKPDGIIVLKCGFGVTAIVGFYSRRNEAPMDNITIDGAGISRNVVKNAGV